MKEILFNIKPLVRYQRICRNLLAAYFIAVTALAVFGIWYSRAAVYWGVLALLLLVFGRLFVFAVQFQKAKMYRFALLSYLLGVILLSTVVLRYWVL